FHRIPALWLLHRMHHADLDYDLTTGLRFHPLELVISFALKSACVVALGAPAWAALAFEIALNGLALFNHANASLPTWLEPFARALVVTPDMHRVHHSVVPAETHSNFGFNLSIWDRLFYTYRAAPAAGPEKMTIGLPQFRGERELRLDRMLTQPFRNADENE
ncbi:MAG: sterol desaturase family protein, partial [Rhodoblastus sp.]